MKYFKRNLQNNTFWNKKWYNHPSKSLIKKEIYQKNEICNQKKQYHLNLVANLIIFKNLYYLKNIWCIEI